MYSCASVPLNAIATFFTSSAISKLCCTCHTYICVYVNFVIIRYLRATLSFFLSMTEPCAGAAVNL